MIEYENLSPRAVHLMKIDVQRKVVRKMKEDDARKEGIEEGMETEKIEMAALMKKEGEPLEKISKYTGLSKEEIQKL